MKEIIGDYEAFVENINRGLEAAGIHRDELALLDHLGYRTETVEEYHEVLERFRQIGEDMGAIEIEGRPINIINLHEPIKTGGWIIPFLEVIAPKASSPYPSGLEHAEFVTVQLLRDFEAKHPNLNFIRNAMGRRINPELKYRENGISVKFHRLSIGTVVQLEEELAKASS
jgi:predicted metalloenzyme YecM